jgi:adenosine/AMP kinase
MELESVPMQIPEGANLILGQSHFIKTVEDLYEALVNTVPGVKFAIAFNEASGPCLVRVEANDDELRGAAVANATALGAGHAFVVLLRGAFPVNVLGRIKDCFEVCNVWCATANPVTAVVARAGEGRAVLGVADGSAPKGVEGAEDVAKRKQFLRQIGYKQ